MGRRLAVVLYRQEIPENAKVINTCKVLLCVHPFHQKSTIPKTSILSEPIEDNQPEDNEPEDNEPEEGNEN